jgi:glutamate/tyrosine decarboxylase-like PLP-dependent enzyme
MSVTEQQLMAQADERAQTYLAGIKGRRVFPDAEAIANLSVFAEALPEQGCSEAQTLAMLDDYGSPATVASNGPNYYGFVIGATLPAASAAERMMLAWDQCAFSFDTSPIAATLERKAAEWVLDILDLPRESAVGFGTSATACTIGCLHAARRALLAKHGWDLDADGFVGAPEVKVIVPDLVHVTVKKALRLLGFGMGRLLIAPTDGQGRIDPEQMPPMDDLTILCLQAGEVNTGNFDPFAIIIPKAKAAGAWVHVDGAFGLWARASTSAAHLTEGIERADSWTTDGHKWLNTPYDGAMAICRDAEALARAMNSDAVYASASAYAQKNLTLEFSRRARGIPIWAALRTMGRAGVAELIDRHIAQAKFLKDALKEIGFEVLNDVVINQVLVRSADDEETAAIRLAAVETGETWFGGTVWQGRPAFRISISSWRTTDAHIDKLIALLKQARDKVRAERQNAAAVA